MSKVLVSYLAQRNEAATFLLPAELDRTLPELFTRPEEILPEPFRIYPADETQQPALGFPVADAPVMKELEGKLERWITEEIALLIDRGGDRERAASSFNAYLSHLMKVVENALMSNLLNDYHAVFWLAHSFDLARQFSSIPRRVSAVDAQIGRTQGDGLKYRIFGRWVGETRTQMTQLAARVSSVLEGEEHRGLRFFRLLQDDVLILTEEFIGPDLRELRTFITGYLRRDFHAFRDSLERLRMIATDLLQTDRSFRAAFPLLGVSPEGGITLAMLLDPRFETFLFDLPPIQNAITREEREQLQLLSRRVREYAVLNQLRRGIVWMTSLPDGQIVSADRRTANAYSRSTRPMHFGRPGVVDPVIHRFGMIYDISAFSETLGNIRRAGGREEVRSYRQMLLFQRRMDAIAQRHLLQFEKFLGDGAFYTTRRALRVVRAAVEIQNFYAEMRKKGFAFNKGLRIALNYGYYRLLPMKTSPDSNELITEFYGPGIVELSRLTTGKATKEIAEFASFLVAKGFDPAKVQHFFAPLQRGVEVVDQEQEAREFYAYLDGNGQLVNEGIVASMPMLQELSNELTAEGQQLFRVRTSHGNYIAFSPAVPGVELLGAKLIGNVTLKGLDSLDVGELVPFASSDPVDVDPLEPAEPFVMLLRQDFHQQYLSQPQVESLYDTTSERLVTSEIVICIRADSEDDKDEVLIGRWDPRSDNVHQPLRLPRGDFQRLFALRDDVTSELLERHRESVCEMYERLAERSSESAVGLSEYRNSGHCDTFVLGEVVEKL